MMTNLFSIFDPSTSFSSNLNWVSVMTASLIFPMYYWPFPSRAMFFMNKIMKYLFSEIKLTMKNSAQMTLPFMSVFLFIALNNTLGLLPYIFTGTSHITMSLTLALSFWLTFILFAWHSNPISSLAHLVPSGTPTSLLLFMAFVEFTSSMIRPVTLAIRLSANMIAGHLLLSLLGNMGSTIPTLMMPLLMITQFSLLMLEFAVAIIQSYVFTILVTLYASET